MLIDYEYKDRKLMVSFVNGDGLIKIKYYPWSPTKYVVCSEKDSAKSPQYTTWNNRPVKEVPTNHPNRNSIYDFLDSLPDEEKKLIFEYNEPNIFFVDIENEILDKKPEPQLAESAIQTISIVNKDKVLVIGTKKLSESEIASIKDGINNHFTKLHTNYEFYYKYYVNEYEMLLNFFTTIVPKMPVMTGWNFVKYDWVFLVNRARKIGIDPRVSSFTGLLRESLDADDFSELPAHRVIVDYMNLYQKWDTSIKVKESDSLDFVSDNILGVKKVNYEGNLTYLYKNDYSKFVMYNAIDSALVQQIHYKQKYVDIMYGISTLSRIRALDAFSTLPVTEGILREPLRREKNIVFVKNDNKDDLEEVAMMQVKGGWVKDPIVGMNSWTCCFDFASLYPTTIRELNISADSYLGQVILAEGKNFTEMLEMLHDGEDVYAIKNNIEIKLELDDIITLSGAVFKNEDGVVKNVMSEIYQERKRYKKMMMKANEELKELQKELEKLELELA